MTSHPDIAPGPAVKEGALTAYLDAIRAHQRTVVLITLAALLASIAVLLVRTPQYEASSELLVQPISPDDPTFVGFPVIRDSGDPTRTIQTAASLVESRAAADLAAESLGEGWTGESVLEAVEVVPLGDSDILSVTATTDDPDLAVQVANEFADSARATRTQILRRVGEARTAELAARLATLGPADEAASAELTARLDQIEFALGRGDPTLTQSQAAVEGTATSAPAALILFLALVAGGVLGSGTALLLELTTRRVRDEEEAMQLYPLPVLARVPELSTRNRRSPADALWYVPAEIAEPYRTLAVQLDQRELPLGALLVTSPSSGDGKTTSAVNLAISLAATGKRVVLLDFDLRKPEVASALGIAERRRLSDLVNPNRTLEDLLVTPSDSWPVHVLPVTFDPGQSVLIELARRRLPQFVAEARLLADCVVVDTPPLGEVSDALRLVSAVDDVLIVMRPGNTTRGHLEVLRELLQRSGDTPEGCILIGAAERMGHSHRGYGYGYGVGAASDLVVRAGGPARAGGSSVNGPGPPVGADRAPAPDPGTSPHLN